MESPALQCGAFYLWPPVEDGRPRPSGRGLKATTHSKSRLVIRAGTPALRRSDTQLLHFFVVILAVEDVPLLAAFEDGAFLVLDLVAGALIDLFFLIQ